MSDGTKERKEAKCVVYQTARYKRFLQLYKLQLVLDVNATLLQDVPLSAQN